MSVVAARPPASWAEPVRLLVSRTAALGLVELQKVRSDNTELVTRMVQPVLWLLIFGQIFSRIRGIPTGDLSYLAYLTPGILAQSALFVAIFFGIQIIWERDAGILTKVMVTPTPRAAIVMAKAFAAGLRGLAPVVVLVPVALLLGVGITVNPLKLIAAAVALMLSAGCLSAPRPTCGPTSGCSSAPRCSGSWGRLRSWASWCVSRLRPAARSCW